MDLPYTRGWILALYKRENPRTRKYDREAKKDDDLVFQGLAMTDESRRYPFL